MQNKCSLGERHKQADWDYWNISVFYKKNKTKRFQHVSTQRLSTAEIVFSYVHQALNMTFKVT